MRNNTFQVNPDAILHSGIVREWIEPKCVGNRNKGTCMGTEQSLNALIEAETANLVFLIHMHCSNKVEYAIHDSNQDQIPN